MRRYLIIIVLLASVAVALTLVQGCGKKGPPLPPVSLSVPAPYDLDYQVSGDQVTLTWNHSSRKTGIAECRDFQVFQAKIDLSGNECPGCPKIFSLLKEVPANRYQVSLRMDPGYAYYYRVRAHVDASRSSSFSNTVRVGY